MRTYTEEDLREAEPIITLKEHKNWHEQAGALMESMYNATAYKLGKSGGTNRTPPKKKRKKK